MPNRKLTADGFVPKMFKPTQLDAMTLSMQRTAAIEQVHRMWLTGNMTADDAMKQITEILASKFGK
jgi:hypothetical protein